MKNLGCQTKTLAISLSNTNRIEDTEKKISDLEDKVQEKKYVCERR